MNIDKNILQRFSDDLDKVLVKRNAREFVDAVKAHLRRYGCVFAGQMKGDYREFEVLEDLIPRYGSFRTYLAVLGGAKKLEEFPKENYVLKGAIVFLMDNGFIMYKPGPFITSKILKRVVNE